MAFNARQGKDPIANSAQRDLVDEARRLAGVVAIDTDPIVTFTKSFRARPADRALVYIGGAAATLTLASARQIGTGRSAMVALSNRGAGTLTIAALAGETTSLTTLPAGSGALLFSDGAGWKGVT